MSPEPPGASRRGQRGESLIESLVAIAILSVVAIAALQGLSVGARSSRLHLDAATAETLLRSAAEHIQRPDQPYVPRAGCPGAVGYPLPAIPAEQASLGYAYQPLEIGFWQNPAPEPVAAISTSEATFDPTCPLSDADDDGLQRIVVRLDTPAGVEQLVLLKRGG